MVNLSRVMNYGIDLVPSTAYTMIVIPPLRRFVRVFQDQWRAMTQTPIYAKSGR